MWRSGTSHRRRKKPKRAPARRSRPRRSWRFSRRTCSGSCSHRSADTAMARDPYKYFRVEAHELLEQLGQGALELEKGAPAPDAVARLLRLAHTLKGAA